jgi:hypothetical protein
MGSCISYMTKDPTHIEWSCGKNGNLVLRSKFPKELENIILSYISVCDRCHGNRITICANRELLCRSYSVKFTCLNCCQKCMLCRLLICRSCYIYASGCEKCWSKSKDPWLLDKKQVTLLNYNS